MREHLAYLTENFAVDDPRWKSVAASVRDAAINAQDMNDGFTRSLNNTMLPEGEQARQWVTETVGRFMPEDGEGNGRFVRSFASRIRQNQTPVDAEGNLLAKHAYSVLDSPTNLPEIQPWSKAGGISNAADMHPAVRRRTARQTRRHAGEQLVQLPPDGISGCATALRRQASQPIGLELAHRDPRQSMHIGIKDLKTGEVYTGKDFSVHGVGTRLVQMSEAGALTDYEADEFALSFLDDSRVSREVLDKNVRAAQSYSAQVWPKRRKRGRSQLRGGQTYLFSQSGVLANAPIYYDGKEPAKFTYEDQIATTKARIARGERFLSGTGAASKGRMYKDMPDLDATFRFDKPTSMDVTQMKRWELAGELPEQLRPRVMTTDMEKLIGDFGGSNLLDLTVGNGKSVAAFDYFGTIASIADRGKLPMTEKGWRRAFKKVRKPSPA